MNRVFLSGNLTRDPEIKVSEKGTSIALFSLAVNRFYRKREGELTKDTHFFQVEAFSRQAEICQQYLKKGQKVVIEGRLRQQSWEAKDGSRRSKISVITEQIQFLSPQGQRVSPVAALLEPGVEEDEIPF